MSVRISEFRLLREVRDYPALLSRFAAGANELPCEDSLLDVLEPDLSALRSENERFHRMLELGELGGAAVLQSERRPDANQPDPLPTRKSRLHQDLEQLLRQIQGRLLILRDSKPAAVQEIQARVEALAEDSYLRDYRPGPLKEQIERLDDRLDRLIEEARIALRVEIERLRGEPRSGDDPDVSAALQRLEQLPQVPESLPTAQRLLLLVRRAREGQLAPDDLRELHQQGGARGRLVRSRSELPVVLNIAEARSLIERGALRFPGETERAQTRDLLEALARATSYGRIDTRTAAQKLGKFIGFRPDEPERTEIGSVFPVRLSSPRIPAFRDNPNAKSILLLVPVADGRIQDLLRENSTASLRIVLITGYQEGSLRTAHRSEDLTYLDLVDLLRLGECPLDQRLHAFQQVLLSRLPLRRNKPYQGGGPVSPEMFRGRSDIIDALRRPKGGTVLFSGRMMGKSSILTKLDGEITARAKAGSDERSAFISCAGDDLLTPLCAKLAHLLGGSEAQRYLQADRQNVGQTTQTPSERRLTLRKRLANLRELLYALVRRHRLTILVDEADRFAAADGERGQQDSLAWLLRGVEFEQPERLRIIFAGFQTIHHEVLFQNGAFAHWFGLKELGPLDKPDAEALVREPFADFGFVFSSQAAVDRILDFTGRHPLLLQEVCSRLMDRVESRRGPLGSEELVLIQAGDVETVCRDDQLRERLRQVLSLNLDDYPRLKLMVYLLLFSTSTPGRSLLLERFSLEDLTQILDDFYEGKFNDQFNRQSLNALLQELVALGLVAKRTDSYEFVNRTFALMLHEDRNFDTELERLLQVATNPERAESRRFFTLAAEDQERVVRSERGCSLVIGLPQSMRTFIARKLYQEREDDPESGAFMLDASGCRSLDELQTRMKGRFKETRKLLTIGDLLVQQRIQTLLLDDLDALAEGPGLAKLIEQVAQRDVHLVLLGGAPLARRYVNELLTLLPSADVVSLRRLRPKDIRDWGERSDLLSARGGSLSERSESAQAEEIQIIFDRNTSEQLARITGGHMALLHPFRPFIRARKSRANECVPTQKDLIDYEREKITSEAVGRLLAPLLPEERLLLRQFYAVATEYGCWDIDWESVEEYVLGRLCQEHGGNRVDWLDRLELLRILDLVTDQPSAGRRRIVLDRHSPVARHV